MKRRLRLIAWLAALMVVVPGVAFATWLGSAAGSGSAQADAIGAGVAPTISVTGRAVAVSWAAVTLGGGAAVTGYRVSRYADGASTPETISASCTGVIAGLSCIESLVPEGTWRYRVAPVRGSWSGAESGQSALATIGAPTFGFSSSATITSLPSTLPGSLAWFGEGETLEFRLDSAGGVLLTGGTTPAPIGSAGTATTSTVIPTGTSDGIHTVYATGSLGTQATASFTIDTTGPVTTASVIQKTLGGVGGYLRQGRTYRVFANVIDADSGVASVTANVSTVTVGATATALTTTGGPWTVDGVSYTYRSASLTAAGTLAAGATAFSVSATDPVGITSTTSGFSVTIDNTAPGGTDVATSNAGVAGRAETGDQVTYTYTEQIDPNAVIAGWDGSATTVTVRLINNGGGDRVQIWNAGNTAQLPLGLIRLGGTGYTAGTVSFTSSTMTKSGTTITVVLGAPSGAVTTQAGTTTMQWTPSATAYDRAGNACSTTAVTEGLPADVEF